MKNKQNKAKCLPQWQTEYGKETGDMGDKSGYWWKDVCSNTHEQLYNFALHGVNK